MNRLLAGAFAVALLIGAGSLCSRAFAADPPGPPVTNTITMNFQNVDIPVLAKFISEITGRNFIIDESVRGKVTIISPSKVTPEQAYSIFQSVLQVKGFTTVQAGKVIKIVPARNVRSSAALTESTTPTETKGDEYVTRMVRLKNIDAASVIGVIQPMVSHDGLVAAFPSDNTVIVTDDAYNVERLLQIIGALDVRGEQQTIVVIPLKLAFAGELAPEIDQLMGAKTQGAGATSQGPRPQIGVAPSATGGTAMGYKVIPDERTNCLIVMAPPLQMREIQEIVAKLDVNPPMATSRIHVYRLKNAQALEMVRSSQQPAQRRQQPDHPLSHHRQGIARPRELQRQWRRLGLWRDEQPGRRHGRDGGNGRYGRYGRRLQLRWFQRRRRLRRHQQLRRLRRRRRRRMLSRGSSERQPVRRRPAPPARAWISLIR